MTRRVRSRSLGLVVCLGLQACWHMEDSQSLAEPEGAPAAESAPAPRQPEPVAVRPSGRRRALLIGINDYAAAGGPAGPRWVRNLRGAVNDVIAMREMLISLYGFSPHDILVLTDQAATREAILRAIEDHLEGPAREGDVVLFYFSGHGSQVRNSSSDEPDRMDETIVPADVLRGVPDISDKDLRALFNRLLDHRVLLTVVLDSCHSGSGVRGPFDGTLVRSVEPDLRDRRDSSPAGPLLEKREALVLSAAEDYDQAYESGDENGNRHGAFSLALLRAMRDSRAGEPAEETFQRARARVQDDKRFQEPVVAGHPRMRRAPLLGWRAGQRDGRTVVAVERVEADGTVILQGGLANGLTAGSELRLLGTGPEVPEVRIRVTKIHGFSRCEGRVQVPPPSTVKTGALAEVVQWTAPPGEALKVWMPVAGDVEAAAALARELAREAPRRGIRWIADPTQKMPTHVLRWREPVWELLTARRVESLGPMTDAAAVLARISTRNAGEEPAALFVQLPAPAALAGAIRVGSKTPHSGVEITKRPEEADYVLAGRLAAGGVEYAWLRPGVTDADQPRTSLPVRTAWLPLGDRNEKTGKALETAVLRLRQIHAWLHLETPPGAASVYELAVRKRDGGGELVADGILVGQQRYNLVLRAKAEPLPDRVEPRYFYIFLIDSDGTSILLYPDPKTTDENRFPVSPGAPTEISLAPVGAFRVTPPYGYDTYFLLTTDERIPNPWVLDSQGVRARGPRGTTPLEELLSITGGWARSATRNPTPAVWSVERKLFKSVPLGTHVKGGK